jgi:hypothetical protein
LPRRGFYVPPSLPSAALVRDRRFAGAALGHILGVGIAANSRDDYAVVSACLSPLVELHALPDEPTARTTDVEPIYYGREGYVRASQLWKAGFAEFRWELRELFDPGRDRIAARLETIARGRASGIEIRLTQFHVWQFESGLLRRQWALHSEAAMFELLDDGRSRFSDIA